MAKEEKRTAEDSNEEPKRDRSYMLTWGSTVQKKQEFADEHTEDTEPSEEDAAKVEASRPGVNPVVSPAIGADGKPLDK